MQVQRIGALVFVPAFLSAGTIRENFDDGNIDGWLVRGEWIINEEENYARVDAPGAGGFGCAYLLVGDETWKDYTVTARLMPEQIKGIGSMAIFTRGELLGAELQGEAWGLRTDLCWAGHRNYPTYHNLLFAALDSCPVGEWYTFRVTAHNNEFELWINDAYIGSASSQDIRPGGLVGIGFEEIRGRVDAITVSGPEIRCEDLTAVHVECACARAVAEPVEGEAPLTVTLDPSGSQTDADSSIADYHWDFGNGGSSNEEVAHETYLDPGRYVITLTVTTNKGLQDSATTAVLVRLASGDVSPWTSEDIGRPSFPGGARYEGQDLLVCGGGEGFSGVQADEGHLVYQELEGDGALVACIKEVTTASPGGLVAVFMRAGVEQDSVSAGAGLYWDWRSRGRKKFIALHRSSKGCVSEMTTGPEASPPAAWVKVERKGNEFTSSYSLDGNDWAQLESIELQLPFRIVAAVAVGAADRLRRFDFTVARVSAELERIGPAFRRGDANDDRELDLADPIAVLVYLFAQGKLRCEKAGDTNDDGKLDIADAISSLGFLFGGAAPPPAPYPGCGVDPTRDDLTCDSFTTCP